jgi:hypothetical protein
MTAAVKAGNVFGADAGPVAGPCVHQPAGDIERPARIILFEHVGTNFRGADRRIIESEADHRTAVVQLGRCDAQMSRQPVADARFQI